MYEGRRLITAESKRLSGGEHHEVKKPHKRLGGILIESAEGVRFAYTETQIRSTGRPLTDISLPPDLQALQDQRLDEVQEIKTEASAKEEANE